MQVRHRAPEPVRKIQRRKFVSLGLFVGGVVAGLALMGSLGAVPVRAAKVNAAQAEILPAVITPTLPILIPAPKLAADTNTARGRLAGKNDGDGTRARLGADPARSSSSPRGASEHAKSGDARKPRHPEYRSRHRSPKHHHKTGRHHGSR